MLVECQEYRAAHAGLHSRRTLILRRGRLHRWIAASNADLNMVAPVPLAAPAAVYIDDYLVVAELELGDLHVIASIDGCAVRGHGTIEMLCLQRLAYGDVETFLARRQGLDGFGKFTRDVADHFQL